MGYDVKVVNRSGVVLATFNADQGDGDLRQKATVEDITWELNEPGSFRVRVPLFHPAATSIVALTTELQVWRDGVIIHWGVALQRTLAGQSVVWTCPGLLWYFTRLYFGPVSIEKLTNPRFATDLSGWTAVGCTATRATNLRIRGPGTARLVATSSGDNYLQQTFTVTTGALSPLGLTLAAWYWIDPSVPYEDTAFQQRGAYIQVTNGRGGADGMWEPITMNAENGRPQRVQVNGAANAGVTNELVTVRLYCPHGAVQWGACSVTIPEALNADLPYGSDHTEMMRRIVDYAQNGTGKFNLNIGTSTPASGTVVYTGFAFADLPNVFETLKTYPDRGIADYEIRFNATVRTFTTYAPRKGSLKAYTPTVPGVSVATFQHSLDGQQTATQVIRRGPGEGSSRELGVATNTAPLGGLILQDIDDIPLEITLDGFDDYASADVARLSTAVAIPDFVVPAADVMGVVEVGDTIPVAINWGAVQDTTTRRIVRMTLNPATETVTLGVNIP